MTADTAPYVTAGADSTIGASPMYVTAGTTGGEASYVTAGGAKYVMAGAAPYVIADAGATDAASPM